MTITALIDFAHPHDSAAPRLRHAFGAPRERLVAHQPQDVRAVLDAVQAAAAQGAWCVGGLRYEAAQAFDAAFKTHPADGPLAWFAVYDAPLPWPTSDASLSLPPEPLLHWHSRQSRAQFDAAFETIQQAIGNGEFYQVNYTAQMQAHVQAHAQASVQGDGHSTARALFTALQRAQPGGYAAFIDMGDEQVLSVSPELFFDWRAGTLLARPMKGTAPRGVTPAQDAAQAQTLRSSVKERAENVMIVDLLRNDVSRIAQPFSVQVPRLFHTEALPAVWQMTSDVQAKTREGCSLVDVFAALFPCGSITGAPKVQAMQTLCQLEAEPRGMYCGAIGVVRPGPEGIEATFNVPIRTVTLRGDQARCGIGSGITSGAEAESEWQEWQHKRAFLERASAPFDILETLALQAGELRNANLHFERMQAAAAHFGYAWHAAQAQARLQQLMQAHAEGLWRVRLLLNASGQLSAQAFAMEASPPQVQLQLADRPLQEAHGEFVRFKTTRRAHYDAFTPGAPGVFDTVLWNAEGEITECARGNVAVQMDGRWLTPPLTCGLLPGVGRAVAIEEGRLTEAVVRVDELHRVQAWAFVNSLRGWIEARMV